MLLRPSGSAIWVNCAANPLFSSLVPEQPETDESREGTCAAWVADCVLKGDAGTAFDMLDRSHSNGWLVEYDMVQHVQAYIDFVKSFNQPISAEQYVKLTENIKGTLDSSVAIGPILRILDLKYGMSIVEVDFNTQLIIYAAGEYLRLGSPAEIQEVELIIYQPRAFHPKGIVRRWKIPISYLLSLAQWIIERGEECQKPVPVATPGTHCKYCKAVTGCAANAMAVYDINTFLTANTAHRTLTGDELSKENDFLDKAFAIVKARRSAVQAETEQRLEMGEFIKGWGMLPRTGNRQLKVLPETVRQLTGVNPFEKPKTKSPAQLEKDGVPLSVVEELSYTPTIGRKLSRVDIGYFEKLFNKGK